ncbi:unnamed protein product [Xylocopa violacea]|uniref:HTH CENPB-type domain-containing protein n=1 Tax=Xylocopa violacea TaxID=135666 RepID=A0ABP1NYK7_XYLVO
MYNELEERLFTWLIEQTTHGDSLTDALIIEKVAELKETISSCCDFKISIDWLKDFKKRYGIHLKRVRTDQDDPATKFLSICEEERKDYVYIKEEKVQEEYEAEKHDDHKNNIEQEKIINQDENAAEEGRIVNQEDQDENAINEIEYIFERLTYYSTRAPRHIYLMVEGLKLFFLNNTNQ